MPRNESIKKVLVIGSGPIVIGQAAEFDYAGTQACRELKKEGIEVVLINSNPATIMTDKEMADKIYIEPITVKTVEKVIKKEKPDSILPNLGGQTGLNIAMELYESGFLNKQNVKGMINPMTLADVLDILQQVCCIKSNDPLDDPKPKFKNEKARRLYERMLKANKKENKRKAQKDFYNMSLPNIISATAAKNPGLNIINIWDATLFQLYDQFEKAQNDDAHYMNSVRVAVWGDEKNQFDPSLWYKNNFDKQV